MTTPVTDSYSYSWDSVTNATQYQVRANGADGSEYVTTHAGTSAMMTTLLAAAPVREGVWNLEVRAQFSSGSYTSWTAPDRVKFTESGGPTNPAPDPSPTDYTIFVDPNDGNDGNDGATASTAFATVQHALNNCAAGDHIRLSPGVYREDVQTAVSGTQQDPIIISGPRSAVFQGEANGASRPFEVNHEWYTFLDFTFNGLRDNDENNDGHGNDWNDATDVLSSNQSPGSNNKNDAYADKLLYIIGDDEGSRTVRRGIVLRRIWFMNCSGEAVRFKYHYEDCEVDSCVFIHVGISQFRSDFPGVDTNWPNDLHSKSGECIYIGSAPEQLTGSAIAVDPQNPTTQERDTQRDEGPMDICTVWVHDCIMASYGNEAVDIKEGSTGCIIEDNVCFHQMDPQSAAYGIRGSGNTIRNNAAILSLGAGIRPGGDTITAGTFGENNTITGNQLIENWHSQLKLEGDNQAQICGNKFRSDFVAANNTTGTGEGPHSNIRGNFAGQTNETAAQADCP